MRDQVKPPQRTLHRLRQVWMQSRESLPLGQERTEDHLGNINTIEKVNHHGGIKGTQQHPAMSPALVSFIHIVGDRPQNGQEWLSQQNESEPTVDDNVEYTQPSDPTVTAATPPSIQPQRSIHHMWWWRGKEASSSSKGPSTVLWSRKLTNLELCTTYFQLFLLHCRFLFWCINWIFIIDDTVHLSSMYTIRARHYIPLLWAIVLFLKCCVTYG